MVEKRSSIKPDVLGTSEHSTNHYEKLKDIMQHYNNHPINIYIKNCITTKKKQYFSLN